MEKEQNFQNAGVITFSIQILRRTSSLIDIVYILRFPSCIYVL